MENKLIRKFIILIIIYPLVILVGSLLVPFSKGFAQLSNQMYFEGINLIMLSILFLCIVICFCTYEIIKAIYRK